MKTTTLSRIGITAAVACTVAFGTSNVATAAPISDLSDEELVDELEDELFIVLLIAELEAILAGL